jgi:hypothetical protein
VTETVKFLSEKCKKRGGAFLQFKYFHPPVSLSIVERDYSYFKSYPAVWRNSTSGLCFVFLIPLSRASCFEPNCSGRQLEL